jgi:hypothetical protein
MLVFFDDILIYNKKWEYHIEHVYTMLQLLRGHQLFVKCFKCDYGASNIKYLGHIVS